LRNCSTMASRINSQRCRPASATPSLGSIWRRQGPPSGSVPINSVTKASAATRMEGTGKARACVNHWRAKAAGPIAARVSIHEPGVLSINTESPWDSSIGLGSARANSSRRNGRVSGELRARCTGA